MKASMENSISKLKIDSKRFWPSVIILVIICIFLWTNLEEIQVQINSAYNFVTASFSWLFIIIDSLCLALAIYFIFGRYRNVKLGGKDAKPEYSTFSWAAMIFTSSCGAWLLVYGFLEPIYILSSPPFQLTPGSEQAFEYAQLYAHFHWGPSAWCIYVPITIAIGYQIYNRNNRVNSLSVACQPALKNKENGIGSLAIDIIAIFGAIVSPVISIGTGMPVITVLIQDFLGLGQESAITIQVWILIVWSLIFGLSVFLGVKNGIKNFSNINTIGGFLFMVGIGITAGIIYVLESETNVMGMMVTNIPRMQTYTDPYGDGLFVKGWTASYWECYMVYMPLMGVFNAKISRGRTLKQIAFGQLILCSLGCWISMGTLGNYALDLQKSGIVDIVSILSQQGEAAAVSAIFQHMPLGHFFMGIFIILCIIFLCTTMDSSTIAVAEMTTKHEIGTESASRGVRIIWAVLACLLTFILLSIGGYKSIRLLCLLTGLPLGILACVVIISCLKMLRADYGDSKYKLIN